jgi:hypothetical protein
MLSTVETPLENVIRPDGKTGFTPRRRENGISRPIQTQYRWFVLQENEHATATVDRCTVNHVNTRVYTGGQQTKFNQLASLLGTESPDLAGQTSLASIARTQNNIGPLIDEDCRPARHRGYNKFHPRKFDPPPHKYALSQNAFWQTVVDDVG